MLEDKRKEKKEETAAFGELSSEALEAALIISILLGNFLPLAIKNRKKSD